MKTSPRQRHRVASHLTLSSIDTPRSSRSSRLRLLDRRHGVAAPRQHVDPKHDEASPATPAAAGVVVLARTTIEVPARGASATVAAVVRTTRAVGGRGARQKAITSRGTILPSPTKWPRLTA